MFDILVYVEMKWVLFVFKGIEEVVDIRVIDWFVRIVCD